MRSDRDDGDGSDWLAGANVKDMVHRLDSVIGCSGPRQAAAVIVIRWWMVWVFRNTGSFVLSYAHSVRLVPSLPNISFGDRQAEERLSPETLHLPDLKLRLRQTFGALAGALDREAGATRRQPHASWGCSLLVWPREERTELRYFNCARAGTE